MRAQSVYGGGEQGQGEPLQPGTPPLPGGGTPKSPHSGDASSSQQVPALPPRTPTPLLLNVCFTVLDWSRTTSMLLPAWEAAGL